MNYTVGGERAGAWLVFVTPYVLSEESSNAVYSPLYVADPEAQHYILISGALSALVCRTLMIQRDSKEFVACLYF